MNRTTLQLMSAAAWCATLAIAAQGADLPPAQSAGASLIPNGGFEQADPADPSKPAHWERPDGLGVQWSIERGAADGAAHHRVICLNTAVSEKAMVARWRQLGMRQWSIPNPGGNAVAETYGLSYYSDPIPVKPGQEYSIQFEFQGPSGGAKVWVRGYENRDGKPRRVYETIVNVRTRRAGWQTVAQNFNPTKHRPAVTQMRVMLFAYYPPGIYCFDNVKIIPVPPRASAR